MTGHQVVQPRQDSPRILRLMPAFFILHTLIWTLLPFIFHANLQRDQIEGFAWGYEWQWGYAKHPPLWAWCLEATTFLTGRPQAFAAYILGALSGTGAFYFIWRLGQRLASPIGAALSGLMLEGILYLNFRTVDFNANVVLLPLWAAAGLMLHKAVADHRQRDWIGLGVVLALGLYGKYVTGILIAAMVIFLLVDPVARRRLFSIKPWIGVAAALLCLLPHVLWLVSHGLQPVDYALARTGASSSLLGHITQPIIFLAKQLPEVLGFMILGALLIWKQGAGYRQALWRRYPDRALARMEQRMVMMLAAGPLIITALICAAMGKPFVAAWGLPMFCFWGLAFVMLAPPVSETGLVRFLRAMPVVIAFIMIGFAVYYSLLPEWRNRPSKTQFPGHALAKAVQDIWDGQSHGAPLDIIGGPIYVAGNAAFYLDHRPHVLIDGDLKQSPWIDGNAIAPKGMMLVWLDEGQGLPDYLANFPGVEILESRDLPFDGAPSLKPLRIGFAIVHPAVI